MQKRVEAQWRLRSICFGTGVGVILVVGALVRSFGVSTMALWADEAVIANVVSFGRLANYTAYPASNRPFGYLLISGWLASTYNTEWLLRSTSLVPSVGALVLFAAIASNVLRSRSLALAALGSFALNAWSITFAKEFKPYALEQFVALGLLFVCLCQWDASRTIPLLLFGLLVALVPLFSHTGILLIPFGAAAILSTRPATGNTRARCGVALGVAAACLASVSQYVFVGSHTPPELFTGASASYFQYKGVFAAVVWPLKQWARMIIDFGSIQLDPPNVGTLAGAIFGTIYLGGSCLCLLWIAAKRDLQLLFLLIAPVLATAALAVMFPWPLGPERVNLFLVPLVILTAFVGWDRLVTWPSAWSAAARVLLAVLSIACQAPTDLQPYRNKYARFGNAQEEIVEAIETIASIEEVDSAAASRPCVLFSNMSRYALNYYLSFSATRRDDVRRLLWSRPLELIRERDAKTVRESVEHALFACPNLWIVLSHYNENELQSVRDEIRASARTATEWEFVGVKLFAIHGS